MYRMLCYTRQVWNIHQRRIDIEYIRMHPILMLTNSRLGISLRPSYPSFYSALCTSATTAKNTYAMVTVTALPVTVAWAVLTTTHEINRTLFQRPKMGVIQYLMSILRSILSIGCYTELAYAPFIQNNILYEWTLKTVITSPALWHNVTRTVVLTLWWPVSLPAYLLTM
jgi:hypothetical protein